MSLTHEDVIMALASSMTEAGERMVLMRDALRDVQLLHSRALIELPPKLEQRIIALIGPHSRDGGEAWEGRV